MGPAGQPEPEDLAAHGGGGVREEPEEEEEVQEERGGEEGGEGGGEGGAVSARFVFLTFGLSIFIL